MKHKGFFIILSFIALFGCQKNVVDPNGQNDATQIKFSINEIQVETKGVTQTTKQTLVDNGFNFIMHYGNNSYEGTANASKGDGVFYTDMYYPLSPVDFWCWYPDDERISCSKDGVLSYEMTSFSQRDDSICPDIVTANKTNVTGFSSPVFLTFDHALAQIMFRIKGDGKDLQYRMKELSLIDVPTKGDFSITDKEWNFDETDTYCIYPNTSDGASGMIIPSKDATQLFNASTVIPNELGLHISWDIECGGVVIGSFGKTVKIKPERGVSTTYNITLPSETSEIVFDVTILPWQDDTQVFDMTGNPLRWLTLNVNNASFGKVNGAGRFSEGSETEIEAIPNRLYEFEKWSDENTENPRTVTVDHDMTLTAIFKKMPTAIISVDSENKSKGTVTGGGETAVGDTVTIKALPKGEYIFNKWNDGNTENPRIVTASEDITYTASFREKALYTCSVTIVPEGAGEVFVPTSVKEGSPGTIIANAHPGYTFDRWSDDKTTSTIRSDVYYSDLSLTAYFKPNSNTSYLTCRYNVTNTGDTKILGSKESISMMSVDGGDNIPATNSYMFNSTGEHSVTFYIRDDASSFAGMFQSCTNLIHVDGTHVNTEKIDLFGAMFNECSNLEEVAGFKDWDLSKVPNDSGSTVIIIGVGRTDVVFQQCFKLKSIIVPDVCPEIGRFMYNHLSSAENEEVYIPASVERIGAAHCFYNCGKDGVFKRFVVDPANTHFKAVNGALYSYDGKVLYSIPRAVEVTGNTFELLEGVTKLGELSFSREQTFTRLLLPDSYVINERCNGDTGEGINTGNSLSVAIYSYTAINEYAVKGSNPNYIAYDGCVYSKDGTKLIAVPNCKNGIVNIKEGCTTINREAIWESSMGSDGANALNSTITGINIPSTVTQISLSQIAGYNRMVNEKGWIITVDPANIKYYVDINGKLTER